MKKFFKKLGKIFCGAALIGAVATSTAQAAQDPAAMEALREAVEKSSADNRIFHQDIYFVVPTVQSSLEFIGRGAGQNFNAAGDFDLWVTSDNGETTNLAVPFYVAMDSGGMQIYFNTDGKWKKIQSPSLAAVATDKIATPESADFLQDVKEVSILRETDTQRIMLVRLDGNKIADDLKAEAEKNPADNATAGEKIIQDSFVTYLDAGLRNSEIWYTWTINKQTWTTTALSINLSSLVQQTALAALNDDSQDFGEFFRNILETLAYYSETKAYTTFLNDDAAKKLEIPKKVLKAKSVTDFVESKN